jgi:16S rRNA (guanine527-N7)-methyltransferase
MGIMMDLKAVLCDGAMEFGLRLDDKNIDMLWAYKDFLKEYNKKVNLTAIKDDEGIVVKHFLDCLSVLPHIKGGRVIDIGTGPGFPGMVLKIVRPDLEMVLLDARAKKVKFLNEAVALLGLCGIDCVHGRAEEISGLKGFANSFDYAASRAVASLETLAGWCLPFVKPGGSFIAMKGPNYKDELKTAQGVIERLGCEISEIITLTLPKTDMVRNLIIAAKL